MKRILLLIAFCASLLAANSQTKKIYFDKYGQASVESSAYYYREVQDISKHLYKSFYINGNALYFEGVIKIADNLNEERNLYSGKCTWYFKNGKKKFEREYDSNGLLNGLSSTYYESGKIAKEVEYVSGKIASNRYKEYTEDGQVLRIFEENFIDNSNDWDLFTGEKSSAKIAGNKFEIASLKGEGTSRYINLPIESKEYTIEAVINTIKSKDQKAGMIWGFKDWQNYNYFLIKGSYFYIGAVYEGIKIAHAEGLFSADILSKSENNLKILADGDLLIFTINGAINYKSEGFRNIGSNIGFALSGTASLTCNKLVVKEMSYKNSKVSNSDMSVKATGSGLMISSNGYILTNYHVVENCNKIVIEHNATEGLTLYEATVVQKDIDNDLALLKIEDESFSTKQVPFSFKESGVLEVGASVFTIGYPYALNGMGKEAKFNDGKISAKTGYNNAINTFQTTIAVQPGNSGGPVFNNNGQLIGLVNAKFKGGDNVSYAIKLNYIKNLIELLPQTINLPPNASFEKLSFEEKIKSISNYVVLIKIK